MNKRRSILLIIGKVHSSSSQGIRYHNLMNNFGDDYEIKVLTLYPTLFLNKNFKSKSLKVTSLEKTFKWILNHVIERFLFPDKYIFKIRKYKALINNALLTKTYDYIILGLTPFSLYKLASFIKRATPDKYILCDLSDPFIKNAANNYWIPFWEYRINYFEKRALSYVNRLIVLNPVVKILYAKTYKSFNAQNIYVVEQGVPEKPFIKNNTEFVKNFDDKGVKLLYAGGMYTKLREPFELYKAIESIDNHELVLDIYGNIKPVFSSFSNKKIVYKGIIPQSRLFEEYLKCQILVFIDNAFGIQVPGKLFEIISQDKPVLFIYSNSDSPSLLYLKDSTNIFLVKNEATEIQLIIEKILNTDLNSFTGTIVSNYTWIKLADKYREIIEHLND